MDVFFLDALCEMLDTPLHLFNYLHRRIKYFGRAFANNELAILKPNDRNVIRGIIGLEYDWQHDDTLEDALEKSPLGKNNGLSPKNVRFQRKKLGRNDLCHCGSGKKYKKCHLNNERSPN